MIHSVSVHWKGSDGAASERGNPGSSSIDFEGTMLKPILLVEDNPKDVELALIALERSRLSNEVVVVRDGEEALAYLNRTGEHAARYPGNPAVILLDLKLPKISGLRVLEVVRADAVLRSVPVVMLTSSNEEPDLKEAYRLGVNAYVVKPVNFSEFVEAISGLGIFWAILNEPPAGSVRPVGRLPEPE